MSRVANGTLNVRKLRPDAILPHVDADGNAGLLIYSCDSMMLEQHRGGIVNTGVCIELPEDTVGLLKPMPDQALKSVDIHTTILDAGYHAELKLKMHNHGPDGFQIVANQPVARLYLIPAAFDVDVVEVKEEIDPALDRRLNELADDDGMGEAIGSKISDETTASEDNPEGEETGVPSELSKTTKSGLNLP